MSNEFNVSKLAEIPPTEKAEGHKIIYVNSSRMGLSPWDIRFSLGHVVERAGNQYINEEQVTIVMAPTQAKAFARALLTTIQTFENAFGEIADPLGLIKKAASETAKSTKKS